MTTRGLFDGPQEELRCFCDEPAPYLFMAPLDTNTGQPKWDSGIIRAICQGLREGYRCDFQQDWGGREYSTQHNLRDPTTQFPGVSLAHHMQFTDVSTTGHNNRVGNTLTYNSNYFLIDFSDLHKYSTPVLVQTPPVYNFETMREYSARVNFQGVPGRYSESTPSFYG
ncbi:hypothetical protein GGR54DRAFT_640497 [Hypoxylon sp. NC1633]|nr:hypothetical protein GGR54DRAFT_640497 [Hypoxylon sp. NC1633]